jgi:hypothetical protein
VTTSYAVPFSASDLPALRLRFRESSKLSEAQHQRRQKVLDRIKVEDAGVWRWTGQTKIARGLRYPQFMMYLPDRQRYLLNARHLVFYMATGWVSDDVQQYRTNDGDPLNIHPENLVPVPVLKRKRSADRFMTTEQLRDYFG